MDLILPSLLSAMTIAIIIGLLLSLNRKKIVVINRLEEFTRETESKYLPPELNYPFRERISRIFGQLIARLSIKLVPGSRTGHYVIKLEAAGNPGGLKSESFMVIKYLFLLVMLIGGIISKNVSLIILFGIVGLLLPDWWLKNKGKKRREQIRKSLPDVLDLLNVSVEAGLGFDAALQKVIEKLNGPLPEELNKALQEINLGKPRREALRDMAERLSIDEVTIFVGSITQAEQLGVSISNVLRLQSSQVRAGRRMRAEEKAQQAPIKILIPLLLFIFPTILIVLLGPAVIQLIDTFN